MQLYVFKTVIHLIKQAIFIQKSQYINVLNILAFMLDINIKKINHHISLYFFIILGWFLSYS